MYVLAPPTVENVDCSSVKQWSACVFTKYVGLRLEFELFMGIRRFIFIRKTCTKKKKKKRVKSYLSSFAIRFYCRLSFLSFGSNMTAAIKGESM